MRARDPHESPESSDGEPGPPGDPVQPLFPHQSDRSRNRRGMILTVVVAVAALGVGSYFLVSSKSNAILVASSKQTNQVTGGQSAATPAANAPFANAQAPAGAAAPVVTFTPPSDYDTSSLVNDPGCVDYNNATDLSSAAIGDQPTSSQAVAALTTLGGSLTTAARQAQDPTLSAALAAEAAFVEQNQATLVTALVSGDSDSQVAAYQPIEDTDDYVSAVCGADETTDPTSD